MQDHGGQGVCIGYSRQYQRQGGGRTIVVITPSARPYLTMKPEDLAVGDMDGNVVSGPYKPPLNFPCIWVFIRKDRR